MRQDVAMCWDFGAAPRVRVAGQSVCRFSGGDHDKRQRQQEQHATFVQEGFEGTLHVESHG